MLRRLLATQPCVAVVPVLQLCLNGLVAVASRPIESYRPCAASTTTPCNQAAIGAPAEAAILATRVTVVDILRASGFAPRGGSTPLRPVPGPLCSPLQASAIKAISAAQGAPMVIGAVPTDSRNAARYVFANFFADRQRFREGEYRIPLLCNAGYRGQGKTVQLGMCLAWARQRDPGTLALSITFNDDQTSCPGETSLPFATRVTLRVLHRLTQSQAAKVVTFPNFYGDFCLRFPTATDISDTHGSREIVPVVKQALQHLGITPPTNVFLAVDELSISHCASSGATVAEQNVAADVRVAHLKSLCVEMDSDVNFSICVSAFGCFDISALATGSSRSVMLMPLPPLLPERSWLPAALPPILQPFADPTKRQRLPFDADHLLVYSRLSKLVAEAGWYGRRLSMLFTALAGAPAAGVIDAKAAKNFLDLNETRIRGSMNGIVDFPGECRRNLLDEQACHALLARMTRDFAFPTTKQGAEEFHDFLRLTATGVTQFLPIRDGLEGRAFVPQGVLAGVPNRSLPTTKAFHGIQIVQHPCPWASLLSKLGKSLDEYLSVAPAVNAGKSFENLFYSALRCWIAGNDAFTLSQLVRCSGGDPVFEEKLWGDGLLTVKEKGGVLDEVEVNAFPSELDGNDVRAFTNFKAFKKMRSSKVILPKSQFNLCGDVVGVFTPVNKSQYYAVVVHFQLKDWFSAKRKSMNRLKGTVETRSMLSEWRWAQQFARNEDVSGQRGSHLKVPNEYVKFSEERGIKNIFVLVGAQRPIDYFGALKVGTSVVAPECEIAMAIVNSGLAAAQEAPLGGDEAWSDLALMTEWLPSAGYSAVAAHRLRQMFHVHGE